MSMRVKVAIVIMLIIIVFTAASFFSGLFFTKHTMDDAMEHELTFAIDIVDSLISTKINLLKSNATTVAERLIKAESHEQMMEIMEAQRNEFTEFISLTVYDHEKHIANYGEPISHDIFVSESKYIIPAFAGRRTITTTHYNSLNGAFIMHVLVPMGQNYVLSATIPGMTFADIVKDFVLWKTGSIFMVDETGKFIANSRPHLVAGQRNYIVDSGTSPELKSVGNFILRMITSSHGTGRFFYQGKEHYCVYKRISGSTMGWYTAVVGPLDEAPYKNVFNGLLFSSLLFLFFGAVISVFVSGFAVRPFYELEKLNETIKTQAAKIQDEHERAKLMLDAMPLACTLWDNKLELFDCNEETARLFKVKNKQEFLGDFFAFVPEYQPDGRLSTELAFEYKTKAIKEGKCVFECIHQAIDGTPIPAEVSLVRVAYGGSYVIAGYVRDLREHKKMMGEIVRQDELLHMVNNVAVTMLTTDGSEDFETSLLKSMETIGRSVGVGSFGIWQNELVDGELHAVLKHLWFNEEYQYKTPAPRVVKFPYSATPEWDVRFTRGEYINGPISSLSQEDRDFLSPFEIESSIILPLFLENKFWGFCCINDYQKARTFTEEEIDILFSGWLMMGNAMNRNSLVVELRETHERIKLLLNAMPLACRLWNRERKIFECNEESVKLFKLKDEYEFMTRYHELSPKYQPDGQPSYEKAMNLLDKAFKEGRCEIEWMNQTLDGTPIPTEIILVRVPYGNDYVIAGYTRDLREHKKMMSEIEKRDNLLNTVNAVAGILLQSGVDDFERDLYDCMDTLAEAVDVNRIYIWKNNIKDDRLYCTQLYEWSRGAIPQQGNDNTIDMSYDDIAPEWEEILSNGNCISGLVRDMKGRVREQLSSQGVLSVFVAPVFLRDQFWGFFGYDDCMKERLFSENEQSILRSGGMVIANALLRYEMLQNIQAYSIQLEAALNEAQKANAAKSIFLANMSHEMRTPLNAVIGLAGLCLEADKLNDDDKANLETIFSAGTTLLNTVNDILDISKIEAGKLELVPIEYDIPSLISDTVTQNIMRIGEKPIELILDINSDMFTHLYGDELRIRQITNNLLSNAIKYTKEGTVELNMRCERENDVVWLTIQVKDTGIGIRQENMDKLFFDYAQIDMESNRKIEGTGLGLPITKRLTEMMDGSISVDSEYGKGSVFMVRLKQKFTTDAQIGPDVVESLKNFKYSGSRHDWNVRFKRINLPYARVLVVDDNLANLDVAKGLLKPYRMQIDCVNSGQKAIDAIRDDNIRYNAVFMDHMMPGMDGIEAANAIRALGTDYAKNLPIIALTANVISGNEEMFLNKGFQAFLSKPVNIYRLDEVIRYWIRDKVKEKELNKNEHLTSDQLLADLDNSQNKRILTNRRSGIDRRMIQKKYTGLNIEKGIRRFCEDEKVYFNVLRSFAKNTRPLLDSIVNVSKESLNDYATTVHGIKGSSHGIFADMLGDAAERLEKAAKAGDYEYVSVHNKTFLNAAWKLIHDLEEMLKDVDSMSTKPTMDKPDDELLRNLHKACEMYDIDGVDAAMAAIESYQYESDDGLAAWLRENVNLTNFRQIEEKLSILFEQRRQI